MSISTISYGLASFVYLVFFAILLTDKHRGNNKLLLLAAALISAIWALLVSVESGHQVYPRYVDFFAVLKSIAWLAFMTNMLYELKRRETDKSEEATSDVFKLVAVIIIAVVTVMFVMVYFDLAVQKTGLEASIHLLLSIAGIVVVEQLYRNVSTGQRWIIKYLCIGLVGAFLYEFYMYSDALLYQRLDIVLWETRGFVLAILVPLIAFSVLRDPLWTPEIYVSRRVVFHTTALLASAVYLFIMGLAGYYVKQYGGDWGAVLQAFLLFATIVVLALFLGSRRIRAKLKVFLNKHFYPYKYDYREEWLRLIRTISSSTARLYHESIHAIAQIIGSPSGMLWINTGHGYLECVAGLDMECIDAKVPTRSSLTLFLRDNEFVINVDEYVENPEMYNRLGDLELPEWMYDDIWLVVPLIHIDSLIGFITLKHSVEARKNFNWEDSDLLKTAARQVASYISQQKVSIALAEAKQFERFNKISTYIVHDMKNLVTQLSLIVANAEKHKNNPLFMKDAIKTIDNTVTKMNKMLDVVSSKSSAESQSGNLDVIDLLGELVDMRRQSISLPVPTLECASTEAMVHADRDQLLSIMGHLIQNAQDATDDDGQVRIEQSINNEADVVIRFIDTGCGMSEAFIKEQLFRPFKSTKGKGMGIGVYETREIIYALGGTINVSSTVDVGTTFTVTLPRAG